MAFTGSIIRVHSSLNLVNLKCNMHRRSCLTNCGNELTVAILTGHFPEAYDCHDTAITIVTGCTLAINSVEQQD